jgi:hypothetical protein
MPCGAAKARSSDRDQSSDRLEESLRPRSTPATPIPSNARLLGSGRATVVAAMAGMGRIMAQENARA